jgi:hypothetical protein
MRKHAARGAGQTEKQAADGAVAGGGALLGCGLPVVDGGLGAKSVGGAAGGDASGTVPGEAAGTITEGALLAQTVAAMLAQVPTGLVGFAVRMQAGGLAEVTIQVNVARLGGGLKAADVVRHGRLEYRPGFEDVWVDGEHYGLRARKRARLCLEYLVAQQAFDAASARHLTEEIDPHVCREGGFPRSADLRIHHYFNDHRGKLTKLRQGLVRQAGRNGRFYLAVHAAPPFHTVSLSASGPHKQRAE